MLTTRSPGLKPSTVDPSSTTSPAGSAPRMCGKGMPPNPGRERTSVSRVRMTETARTRMSTSVGPGLGTGRSTSSSTSGPPCSRKISAFILVAPPPSPRPSPRGRGRQTEQRARIAHEDLLADLRIELEPIALLDPALRREHRPVGPEQHAILQDGPRVLHQLWWEVPGRPAREVDVHVAFVAGHGQLFLLPRPAGVSRDDREVRKVRGDVVQARDGRGVLELETQAAAHARAIA